MAPVYDYHVDEKNVDVRFTKKWFGRIKIEVADLVTAWDTNGIVSDDPQVKKWRTAKPEDLTSKHLIMYMLFLLELD